MPPEVGRVADVLADATARLRSAGWTNPRREAVRVAAGVLKATPGEMLRDPERSLTFEATRSVAAAVERRARGEPLAYVTGWTGFRHLTLDVSPAVLIPRPETEQLVDLALGLGRGGVVADIGTGTGCIALALEHEGRFDAVLAVDQSAEALAVARRNAARLRSRVALVRGDLTSPLRTGSVDLLVSNPPYVSRAEYDALDGSVRDFEPREALEGGESGLEITERLLDDGQRVLRPGGGLIVELASLRAGRASAQARRRGWTDVLVHRDLFGRARFLTATRRPT